ncbi:MAG: VWA domain-containing protein, partial [Acidimicrobiales bacterium]
APRRPRWRRHLVATTFIAAIASLVLALAGPSRTEQVPRERATVVLTIDTSLAMGAEDVDPTRIDAAKAAAIAFLDDAPDTVDVGLVSYNGVPVVRVTPTDDRNIVRSAVQELELGEATATGDAIFASLEALTGVLDRAGENPDETPAVIVLLSDGTPTVGRTVEEAVTAAIEASVPVSTVAFGTPDGVVTVPDVNNPGRTVTVPVPVDEPTLRLIANGTGGSFFTAASSDELAAVYRDIGTTVGFEEVDRDVSDWFTGTALVLALLTGLLSLFWFQRLP